MKINIPLASIAQIRAAELAALKAKPPLMQRAGEAVAREALALMKSHKAKRVLAMAGPGNNGGDAWVAAECLRRARIAVTVLDAATAKRTTTDPVAARARAAFVKAKGRVVTTWPTDQFTLIIDGLFGIGLTRAPDAKVIAIINACNVARTHGTHVLAIDLPSGLNAETGVAATPGIVATRTITFIAAKPGLYTAAGPDVAGEVRVETLGIAPVPTDGELLTREAMAALIPMRRRNTHKGTYGQVGIIGGSEGMVGAAVLAARAALQLGAGKVTLGIFDTARPPVDTLHPELMVADARHVARDETIDTFAIGMGLGSTNTASVLHALKQARAAVVDADALNAMATNSSIRAAFQAKAAENARQMATFIITPHPGEAAGLLGVTTSDVQGDRVSAALKLASTFCSVVVLKGAGSVIAHPNGHYAINPTGNPGMASGGMGDALAGMLAALLAQGLSAWDAARLGVYLHGAAADAACHHGMGPIGLTASEVIFEARTLLNSGLDDGHED
jgi:hydroxyethylthiazole kinase-like uncharacterized protein yjeF